MSPDHAKIAALFPDSANPDDSTWIEGIAWLRGWLAAFDLSKLEAIDLQPMLYRERLNLDGAFEGVAHSPPKRSRTHGWRLWGRVATSYPNTVTVPMPPLYREGKGLNETWLPAPTRAAQFDGLISQIDDETLDIYVVCLDVSQEAADGWADENVTPEGCRIVSYRRVPVQRKGGGVREMLKTERRVIVTDCAEALVFGFVKVAYCWLRHGRQTPGLGAVETASAMFGLRALEQFRAERARRRRRGRASNSKSLDRR